MTDQNTNQNTDETTNASKNDAENAVNEDTANTNEAAPAENESAEGATSPQIDELQKALEEAKHKQLMALADLDNFKKRVFKEREEMNFLASASVFGMLLEVVDDLARAIDNAKQQEGANVEGFEIIKDKVNGLISENGIEAVEVNAGDAFDPKQMEAIGTVTVPDETQDGKVVHVERAAYKFKNGDRLVRAAKVIVGKKA